MRKFVLLIGCLLLWSGSLPAQQLLFSENFESTDVSYLIQPAGAEFSDGSADFFIRTDGSDITGSYSVNGEEGTYFFAGMDLDGDGEESTQALIIDSIAVNGYSALRFSVLLAEDDDGTNEDWDASDHLRISARMDGGTAIPLIWIQNDGSNFNSAPRLDTDFDGIGDSTEITDTFQRFDARLDSTGDWLSVRIELSANAGDEDIAVDDIRITGVPVVTIEGEAGWRLLSVPVEDATIDQLSDDTAIQGIAGGSDASAQSNFFLYDDQGSWTTPTDISTQLRSGYGMAIYFFDNDQNGSRSLPLQMDITGSEPASVTDLALNTSNTEGSGTFFTLAGNPYSSNYDLSAVTTDAGFIQDHIHLWDNASQSYQTADRTSGFVIAPWQGFWVERSATSTASTIDLPASGKTNADTSATFFRKQRSDRFDLRFTLRSAVMTDRSAKVAFRSYATRGWDRADASRMMPLRPDYAVLAFVDDERLKAVESLPAETGQEFLLDMEVLHRNIEGKMRLSWEGVDILQEHWEILLTDRHTGEITDLSETGSYEFSVSDTSKAKQMEALSLLHRSGLVMGKSKRGATRFLLHFIPRNTVHIQEDTQPEKIRLYPNYPNPFNPMTTIEYRVEESGPVRLSVYDLQGRQVTVLVNQFRSPGRYAVSWDASGMASGVYYYRLETMSGIISRAMTLLK